MPQLSRTGVSLDEHLLKEFDRLIARRGYENRSEAIRDLIREALLTETVDSNKPVVGTLTLVYDHHVPNLGEKLTETQHAAGTMVLAATHVHLDHHYCLEVIIMKGRSKELQGIADLRRQFEAQIHTLGANVEENISRRGDGMAIAGANLLKRMKLGGARCSEELAPCI